MVFDQSGAGTLVVQSGTLELSGGGTLGGTGLLTAAAGATLAFGGGTFGVAATSGIAGAGTANFVGGTVNDAGSYNITGTTTVSGGTANYTAPVTTLGQALIASGGTINLSGGAPTTVGR